MEQVFSFGAWLQQRRKALSLTQEELGTCVGCAGETIRKIEADARRPSRAIAERLAACLQIATEERSTFVSFARGEASTVLPAPITRQLPLLPTSQPPRARVNLPAPLTPIIGREQEAAAVGALLRQPSVRLVTLTGPGGIGKTRLAVHVANEMQELFADGIQFVALAAINDPALVLPTIAQALDVGNTGIAQDRVNLQTYLRDKHLLLVLDNFEQVVQAAADLAELLAAAPHLKMLVTSRIILRISVERGFPVPPLALPDRRTLPPVNTLAQYAAVALFLARAQTVNPHLRLNASTAPIIATICHYLDGLPLAIELAATRSKLFSPATLLARLERRLAFLTDGARDLPVRHHTLRSTIRWSYDLLSPADQALWARLSIFVGGWTLDAAETLCQGNTHDAQAVVDGIQSLVDSNLVHLINELDSEPRFMILETLREYALERLALSGEMESLQRQHALYYIALAEAVAPALQGEKGTGGDQLQLEYGNLRAALMWCQETEAHDLLGRLVSALWWFWHVTGHHTEGRVWLATALAHVEGQTTLRATLLLAAGRLAFVQGEQEHAFTLTASSLEVFRALGDRWGMSVALTHLADLRRRQGDYAETLQLCEESLAIARAVGDSVLLVDPMRNLGDAALDQGDYARATALFEEGLALARRLHLAHLSTWLLNCLGEVARCQGDYMRAKALLELALTQAHQTNDKVSASAALNGLGYVAVAQGDFARAAELLHESLLQKQEIGSVGGMARALEGLAGVACTQQQFERAARWLGCAAALREAHHLRVPPSKRPAYEAMVATVRAALGDIAFETAWQVGQMLSLEQTIAETRVLLEHDRRAEFTHVS